MLNLIRYFKEQMISPCIEEVGRRDVVIAELTEIIDLMCNAAHSTGQLTDEELYRARRRKDKALMSIYRYARSD